MQLILEVICGNNSPVGHFRRGKAQRKFTSNRLMLAIVTIKIKKNFCLS